MHSLSVSSLHDSMLTEFLQLVAFIVGFALQSIYTTLWVGLAGAALTFLVVVPPYPFYNQSPEPWLPGRALRDAGLTMEGKKIK